MLPRLTSHFWLFVFVTLMSLPFASANADTEVSRFDVKEGDALVALREAAQQANVDFLFAMELLEGVRTRPISGVYAPLEAFQEMLKGTGFVPFRHRNSGVYSVRKKLELGSAKSELTPSTSKSMNEKPRPFKGLLKILLSSAAVTGAFSVSAQDDESVFELSPFQVTPDTEGYAARNSLAGSRINTPLKDLPNSISVMTEEFLDDIAATSPTDAMLYSINVQNLSEYTNVTNTNALSSAFSYEGMNAGRIRGLPGSGRTRDFFLTDIRADTYNLGRVTINSGANAVLYGIGGVAGMINDSLITANTNADAYEVGIQFDNFGTRRLTLDLNKSIVEDKFAIRAAILDENSEDYHDNTGGYQHRQFLTATYNPLKKTTIKAWYENVDTDEQYSRNLAAFDGGAVDYLKYADSVQGNDKYFDNSPGWVIDGPWVGLVSTGSAISNGANRPSGNIFVSDANGLEFIGNVSAATTVVTVERSRKAERPADRGFSYALPESWTYPEQSLYGNTGRRSYKGDIYGVSFQHSFTDNLNLELAYNKEQFVFSNSVAGWGAREFELRADPNLYLPDGVTLNPYRGQLYVEAGGFDTKDPNRYEGYRASLSYHLEAADSVKWLGTHDITVLHDYNEKDRRWLLHRKKVLFPGQTLDGYTYNPGAQSNRFRFYIDPRTGESAEFPFDTHTGGEVSTGQFVYANDNSLARQNFWSGESNKNNSLAATIQSRWLNGRLKTTAGVRDQKQWAGYFIDYGTAVSTGSPNFQAAVPNETDLSASNRNYGTGNEPDLVKSYGGVFDLNDKISFHYNWSDVFATPSSNVTFEGAVGSATGETEEFGISLNTKDGSSGVRFTYYTASSLNSTGCSFCSGIRDPIFRIESQLHGKVNELFDSYIERSEAGEAIFDDAPAFDPGNYSDNVQLAQYNMTTDVVGDGVELEAFSSFKNYYFRLTLAQNNSQGAGPLKGYGNYIMERKSYWNQWAEWEDRHGFVDDGTSIVAANIAEMAPSFVGLSNLDGASVDQSQGIRMNATVRYNFEEGKLKNFNFGAHARYREAGTIGYLSAELPSEWKDWPGDDFGDTIFSTDISSPVKGDDQLLFDFFAGYKRKLSNKVDYNVRLNIRNVLDNDDVIPQRVDSSGTVRVYTYQTPRRISLSTDFTF